MEDCNRTTVAGPVGAVPEEEYGAGGYAAEVADGVARDASAAGPGMRNCVAGEVCDRFAERCLGSARYGLLGATGGRPPTEVRLCISDTHAKMGPTTPA